MEICEESGRRGVMRIARFTVRTTL
ncbi:uncharacterized protein G2W53_012758 [Senna tora]|uniref:Uncharacterized protein n=1 Tax=Senna tora TaxID=362788 RepID=A0A834U1Q0_9FABA|nr:uncharacterized protein G2W53_012758 [Senna tora]